MRVRIEIGGHHFFKVIEGDVVAWSSTVEYFDQLPMQVPCVLVRTQRDVEVVSLKRALYEATVEILEDCGIATSSQSVENRRAETGEHAALR